MAYDDLRGDLILTTADGFRLPPLMFSVPMGQALRMLQDELERSYRIKELELRTRIGTLEAEIEILRRPHEVKRWRWPWARAAQ